MSASGFRLAGLHVRVPGDNELLETIERACEQTTLVLVSNDVARRIPQEQLDRLLSGIEPPVVVIPDVRGDKEMLDLATRLRRQLGVLE